RRTQAAQARLSIPVDRAHQCRLSRERNQLLEADGQAQGSRCRPRPQGLGRHGAERRRSLQAADRARCARLARLRALVSDAGLSIEAGLSALTERYRQRFGEVGDEQALRAIRAEVLGKKGELTGLLRGMKDVPPEQRKSVGERVNRVRAEIESLFEARLQALRRAALEAELSARPFDLTLP